jgi:hypothetical protein
MDVIIGDQGRVTYTDAGVIVEVVSTNPSVGGNDVIDAGDGTDIVIGGFGADHISTGIGDATVLGDNGDITFVGGQRSLVKSTDVDASTTGDDVIAMGVGRNEAIGGYGSDTISNLGGETVMIGDDGVIQNDATGRYAMAVSGNTLIGGNDTMFGGADRDVMFGGFGKDDLVGNGGNDIIFGDAGKVTRTSDQIMIEATDLFTGDDDILDGGAGNNYMIGGFGNDLFHGDFSRDAMIGEYGRIQIAVAPDGSEKIVSVVTLAQGGLDFMRKAMTSLYGGSNGNSTPTNAQSDMGSSASSSDSDSDSKNAKGLLLAAIRGGFGGAGGGSADASGPGASVNYDAFWGAFEQMTATEAGWVTPHGAAGNSAQEQAGPAPAQADAGADGAQADASDGKDVIVQLTPAQLAKLEKKVASRHHGHAKAQHKGHVVQAKAHHHAPKAKLIQTAAAVGPGLIGGAIALAGLTYVNEGEQAEIAKASEALGKLDAKLQRRRFKKWDDVLRG